MVVSFSAIIEVDLEIIIILGDTSLRLLRA